MKAEKKVKYLKIDRGRYYYQRRVPHKFRELLAISKWQMPYGDVSYAKAVQLIVNWAEEHDDLLAKLRTPDGYDAIEAGILRSDDAANDTYLDSFEGTRVYPQGDTFVPFEELDKPWMLALEDVAEIDQQHERAVAPKHEVLQLKARIAHAKRDGHKIGKVRLEPYPEFIKLAKTHAADSKIVEFEFSPKPPRPMSTERYRDLLAETYETYFGSASTPPTDPDDRDEYVFAKRRIERKLSAVTPDLNSISAVLEKYCRFNSIRSGTRSKYRRELARLIAITGDCPINHVSTDDLRQLRDSLIGHIQPASVQAIFTPIKGIFGFAFDEDIITSNPMMGVKLPRDKRPIEERKWKSFDPGEMSRILESAEARWSVPTQGLTVECH